MVLNTYSVVLCVLFDAVSPKSGCLKMITNFMWELLLFGVYVGQPPPPLKNKSGGKLRGATPCGKPGEAKSQVYFREEKEENSTNCKSG